jgi:hypothetical protein
MSRQWFFSAGGLIRNSKSLLLTCGSLGDINVVRILLQAMRRQNRWAGNSGSSSPATRRTLRRTAPSEVYEDLLEEVLQQQSSTDERPLKKRKSQRDPSQAILIDNTLSELDETRRKDEREMVTDDSSNVSSEDDEMEWDNVDLATVPVSEGITDTQTSPMVLDITLSTAPQKTMFVEL